MFKSSHVVFWQVPDFQPVVRDRIMNRTFVIISPYFTNFEENDWFKWFHLKLVAVLPSFTPMMLNSATSDITCTNYHVVWVAFQRQTRLQCSKELHVNGRLGKNVLFFSPFAVWEGWPELSLQYRCIDDKESHMFSWATWGNLSVSSPGQVGLTQ